MLNPMKRDGAIKIEELEDGYKVVMENGDTYIVEDDTCSCGHERSYQPSRSGSLEQGYRERRKASCDHQVALLNAEKLGQCECGNYQVRENKKRSGGRHVMSEYTCTECGKKLRG